MTRHKIAVLLALCLGLAVFFLFGFERYLSIEFLSVSVHAVGKYAQAHAIAAMTAYFVLYVVAAALSLPGAAVLTLGGGALFGLALGTLLISFASTIGATLAFLGSRYLLRDWVVGRFGRRLEAIDAGLARDGAFYLFMLRLVPAFPFFLINLLLGLSRMRTRTFYWVSQLGMFPGTLVYVNAGTQLARIHSLSGILSP
ncbi:MAG: TVP38/TMEM64 family protein, partial [Burkholderiales bacterium]|nr:TVP38/TMEM64 family protein [Burkholderiales bacterium]